MGFLRKATIVMTGGAAAVAIKANSKKERTARAAEQQAALLAQMARTPTDPVVVKEVAAELAHLSRLHDEGELSDADYKSATAVQKRRLK